MSSESSSIKNGRYQLHHFIVSLFCVFALCCIVSSLYSISSTIGKNKRSVKLYTRSLDNEQADLNFLDDSDNAVQKNKIPNPVKIYSNTTSKIFTSKSQIRNSQDINARKKYMAGKESVKIYSNTRNKFFTSGTHIGNSQQINAKKKSKAEKDEKEDEVEYPVFPESYHASGLLLLPHSGIAEPFEIWYAPDSRKSRIDYYYSTDKTFQRADHGEYGVAYKYVPMYNDKIGSFDGCWTLTGTKNRPVIPQIITPNTTWFKYNITEVYTGTMTTKWIYEYYAFGMRNSQSVWITKAKPNRPIRYEMFGFDMMLGSYYDHYVLEYITFEDWNVDDEIFELPKGINCFNWSNSLESSLITNPMQEFTAFTADSAIDVTKRYIEYKTKQEKAEQTSEEETKRKHIFKHNARFINSHNRKGLTFKLKPNHFLDLTEDELDAYHGTLEKDTRDHKGMKDIETYEKESDSPPTKVEIPDDLDWREYGAVTRVKGQGICGACYAFTAAGAAEGAWYRKTGMLREVSAQQLVDCSWGIGNHGCKGGHYAAALSWIYTHGISTDRSYGKYLGQEGYCHFNDTWFGAKIEGFSYIQPWNNTALKRAVAIYGPVAVSINTRPLSFKFYSHGIYSDPKCRSNYTSHSALVVGYGQQNGTEYWLVKNSWSDTWGENGYIKVSMENHLCGVTEYPVAALISKPRFEIPTKTIATDSVKGRKVHSKSQPSKANENKSNKTNFVSNSYHQMNQSVSKLVNHPQMHDKEGDNSKYIAKEQSDEASNLTIYTSNSNFQVKNKEGNERLKAGTNTLQKSGEDKVLTKTSIDQNRISLEQDTDVANFPTTATSASIYHASAKDLLNKNVSYYALENTLHDAKISQIHDSKFSKVPLLHLPKDYHGETQPNTSVAKSTYKKLSKKNPNHREKLQPHVSSPSTAEIPFSGLHVTDADKIQDKSKEDRNLESENKFLKSSPPKMNSRKKHKVKHRWHKAKKHESELLPMLRLAKNIYHKVLKEEREKSVDSEKQLLVQQQKQLHDLLSKFKTTHSSTKKSLKKPSLNPEKIGAYTPTEEQKPHHNFLGSKKQGIEKLWRSQNAVTEVVQDEQNNNLSVYQHEVNVSPVTTYNETGQHSLLVQETGKTHKKNKTLTNLEKAQSQSMQELYSRIDKAVKKVQG